MPLTVNFDRVEAGVAVDQEFDLTFDSPGRHRVDLRLGPDSLMADNARFVSVEVSPVNRVLIIEGNPANDDGEYLVDALAADPGITGYSAQLETVDYLASPFDRRVSKCLHVECIVSSRGRAGTAGRIRRSGRRSGLVPGR